MKNVLSVLAIYLVVVCPLRAMAEDVCVEEARPFPKDVATFVEARCYCDHFRGEPDFDEERRIFLRDMVTKYCTGSDAELGRLKKKHSKDADVLKKLGKYEEKIE